MLIALSNLYGLIKVQGQDAKRFLQGQLTCNMDALELNAQTFAAHCNPQGRVISFFRLYRAGDAYYLCMEKNMLPIALAYLKKYALFYKTELSIENNLEIFGNVEDLQIVMPAEAGIQKIDKKNLDASCSLPLHALGRGWHDSADNNLSAWKLAEIKASIPTIYPKTSGKFLPHELNLPDLHAVSFDKGCYTGQEIIARMQYRGKLKKSLHRVKLVCDAQPAPGAEIFFHTDNGTEIAGQLVDVCEIQNAVSEHERIYLALIVADIHKLNYHPYFFENNQQITIEQYHE